jgi:hypothetical protein
MSQQHPGVDHAVVDHDFHGARVRIVPIDQLETTIVDMRVLFPHDVILSTPMGCCHICVYTHNAPASLVAEHLRVHLLDVEHRVA